jgi:hypothetical protein
MWLGLHKEALTKNRLSLGLFVAFMTYARLAFLDGAFDNCRFLTYFLFVAFAECSVQFFLQSSYIKWLCFRAFSLCLAHLLAVYWLVKDFMAA